MNSNRPTPDSPPPSRLSPDGLGLEWDERAIVPPPKDLEELLAAHARRKRAQPRRLSALRAALGLGNAG